LRDEAAEAEAALAAVRAEGEAAAAAAVAAPRDPREAVRGGGLAAVEREAFERRLADARAEVAALRAARAASVSASASPERPERPVAEAEAAELRRALRLSEERRAEDAAALDEQARAASAVRPG